MKHGFVYIMTNKSKKVLYIGVTSNLKVRVYQHSSHYFENSFTTKYNLEYLVYYEYFESIENAILREKELKGWRREKKDNLISMKNPNWLFLNDEVGDDIYSIL